MVNLASAANRELEPFGQCVNHRNTHTMQPARDLVGVLIELSARMQYGHYDFGGGASFFRDNVGRNAPAVVADGDRTIYVNSYFYLITVPCQSLIDRVINSLEHHMV